MQDAPHGTRRQRSKGGFRAREAAEAFLTDQLARIGDGSYAQPSRTTVAEFLAREWLPSVERTLRPLSHQRHSNVVRLYIAPLVGDTPADAFGRVAAALAR